MASTALAISSQDGGLARFEKYLEPWDDFVIIVDGCNLDLIGIGYAIKFKELLGSVDPVEGVGSVEARKVKVDRL